MSAKGSSAIHQDSPRRNLPPSKVVTKHSSLGLAIRQLKKLWRVDENIFARQFGHKQPNEVINWARGKHSITVAGASLLVEMAQMNGLTYDDLARMAKEEFEELGLAS